MLHIKKILLGLCVLLALSPLTAFAQNAEEAFEKANTAYYKGNYSQAIQDYTKAIQLNPQLAEAYTNRGVVKAHIKDKTGAYADLEKAKQLFLEQNDMEGYKNAIEAKNLASQLLEQK